MTSAVEKGTAPMIGRTGGSGTVGGSGMAKGDCMECRITGTVTCYVAAAYALTQRAAVAQPANRRFLAAFAAVWAALGTARAVI